MYSKRLFFLIAIVLEARAQQREVGILGGGDFVNGALIGGTAAAVTASFSPGPGVGVLIGHDLYSHWSGEIRYLFEERDARLRSTGATAEFATQAHVLHYDLVLHARRLIGISAVKRFHDAHSFDDFAEWGKAH